MNRDAFQAIADPTRREIIGILSFQPMTVNDISSKFAMTRTGVSKHLKILKECGLLTVQKNGRERFCHAKLDVLSEIDTWLSQYRMFWNDNLDHLEEILKKESK